MIERRVVGRIEGKNFVVFVRPLATGKEYGVIQFKPLALVVVKRELEKGNGVAQVNEKVADVDEDRQAEQYAAGDSERALRHGGGL